MKPRMIFQIPCPADAEVCELEVPEPGIVRHVATAEQQKLITQILGKPALPIEIPVLFVEVEIGADVPKRTRFFAFFPHGMPIEPKPGMRAEFVQVLLSERTGTVKYVYELVKEG